MQKISSIQSGIFNLRIVIAVALCSIGGSFGWLSFAGTPSSGTLTPTSGPLTYSAGPLVVNNSPLGAGQLDDGPRCSTAFPCDTYELSVALPPGYLAAHPNASAKVTLFWDNTGGDNVRSDYDLYIYRGQVGDLAGNDPADWQSTGDDTANPEVASILPLAEGTSIYTIKIVGWLPHGEVVNVRIEFNEGSGGAGFPGFGGPDPTSAGIPRYQVSVGGDNPSNGESNIGFNPATGKIITMNRFTIWRITPAENLTPAQPACCPELWENKTATTTSQGVDPILWTDQVSGRTFASNSTAGTNVVYAYSDNDGDLWNPVSLSPPNVSTDHQTIGSGPYPAALAALTTPVNHGQMVFYCAQTWPVGPATCQRSDTLGASYGPSTTAYTGNAGDPCGGIHGHVKVGPDGTVYLPVRECTGNSGLAVSLDGGITWTSHVVPDSLPGGSDPSIAIGANNTIYYSYTKENPAGTEIHAHVRVGTLTKTGTPAVPTITWGTDTDLGESHGVVHAAFPEAVAGDDDRATVGFLGTDRAGFSEGLDFPGYWYLFLATTYDGGETWHTVNATPNDPVQGKGGIWLGGGGNQNRNLLDFNEVTMDDEGYVLFGYGDGCVGGCVGNPDANTFRAQPRVARQVGGKPLLSQFDPNPAEPAVPKAPCLSGTRNASGVHLSWRKPDNAGADLTSYRIFRGTASGNETFLVDTGNTKTTFDDITADPSQPVYYYVKAVNVVDPAGGTPSNEVNFAATPGIQLLSIVSNKTHGNPGTVFPVSLPLDGSGIECRDGGANGDFTMVFNFADPVTSVAGATVAAGTGSVSGTSIVNGDYVVNLTGVTNAQRLTVALTGVTAAGNTAASVSATMGVLAGDTTENAFVNSADISQTKSQSGQALTNSNYREDLNIDGAINSGDISFVKAKSGTALPTGAAGASQPAAEPQRAAQATSKHRVRSSRQ